MSTEEAVAKHYTRGNIEQTILDGLKADGKDIEKIAAVDLAAVDEFHLGGRPATIEFAKALGPSRDESVLDIGCGIGGPARCFAEAHGCRVTGIDLTEEFAQVARSLTKRCGLADRIAFKLGSASALPFQDAMFDVATLIHVGMNISDKAKLFAEARRVLKPGGRFGIYDIMRLSEGDFPYPIPWAQTADTSFMETPATYRTLLEAAGFRIESERNRRDFVLAMSAETRDRAPGTVSATFAVRPDRFANIHEALGAGLIAPVEFIARAV